MEKINENAIKASLYGFFIGDALGVPVEFKPREYFKDNPMTGMTGYGLNNLPAGSWSDDSSMTLATMDGLINGKEKQEIDFELIMMNFLKWKEEGEFTPFGKTFGMGSSTKEALNRYRENVDHAIFDEVACGSKDINSNGNGSLMRILPIAEYLYASGFAWNDEEIFNSIAEISSMTHAHIYSITGCYIYSIFAMRLLNGEDKFDAYYNAQVYVQYLFGNIASKIFDEVYKKSVKQDISTLKEEDIKSSGYVVDTLEAALWATLTSNSFEESVLKAVNLGGDTDTIAALTGGLAGIIYGLDAIPTEWIDALQRKEYLTEMIEQFCEYLKKLNMDKDSQGFGKRFKPKK